MSSGTGRLEVEIRGAVQGVGFRPFVQRLGMELGLAGSVRNRIGGVRIEAQGSGAQLGRFIDRLRSQAPATACVEALEVSPLEPSSDSGLEGFAILPSLADGSPGSLPLDVATCDDCLADLRRPGDRRHRYPFISCALCGPRYSVLEALPYDRAHTTMRRFTPCAACASEYADPRDRRFHAQTVACAACGPRLELRGPDGSVLAREDAALGAAARAIRSGAIVALKGLGGFQLVVDATSSTSVAELRRRKRRPDKPLAVMVRDLAVAKEICLVSPAEEAALRSAAAPIVLLARRSDAGRPGVAREVAPENPDLGILLPCTPLHHLLADEVGVPVVATSANRSGDPICHEEHEALSCLADVADLFLVHDRPIAHPIDDSVVRVFRGEACVLRAARGYAPISLAAPDRGASLLGLGAYLKNTIAVSSGGRAHVSPHIGDLRTPRTRELARRTTEWLASLVAVSPVRRVADLASEDEIGAAFVQHHHAHVIACMAENGIDEPVLGVAWDGNGHGPDGTIWGGEFLICDRSAYRRVAHLRTFPLPGGERAILEGRRAALGILFELRGAQALLESELPPVESFSRAERTNLVRMLERGIASPRTSSMGRLFDAVASLLGLRQSVTFEGQAAMALEFAARGAGALRPYSLPLREGAAGVAVADWGPLVEDVLSDIRASASPGAISASFHDALANLVVAVARRSGLSRVALTGGCFQNVLLLERAAERLSAAGFLPLYHRRLPPNDGAIALGQVMHAVAGEG